MSPARCTETHAGTFTLERRRSDFERDARVTPFTGSCCCCCCCLHWLGAAIGGGIGMRMGWKAAEKRLGAPLPAEARHTLVLSIGVGIVVSTALLIAAAALGEGGLFYLLAVAFVPPLALIPVCLPMLLSPAILRQKQLSAFRREIARLPAKEGANTSLSLYRAKLTPAPKTFTSSPQFTVFCRGCWFDLEESMHLTHCPKCDAAIVNPGISEPQYGLSVAWRATWTGLVISSATTVACYGVMYVILLLIK